METTQRLSALGVGVPRVLLPAPDVDLHKWAVVACDQYTSQPDYWEAAQALVGDAPSTLSMIYPEVYLGEGLDRVPSIQKAMRDCLSRGILSEAREAMVLVERTTESGRRLGLVLTVDLEAYDFLPGAETPIRPTEGTILSRIPPRVAIRQGGALELPHIMLLADDPGRTLIEPLYQARQSFEACYDFPLMMQGGHLRGWFVPAQALPGLTLALETLWAGAGGLLFAVGDGNHSLATARQCWLNLREGLTPAQRDIHPARYAMAEVVNLHDPALRFEPIHRVLFGIDPDSIMRQFVQVARGTGLDPVPAPGGLQGSGLVMIGPQGDVPLAFTGQGEALPLAVLQAFLDEVVAARPDSDLDYIHGEAALRGLCGGPDTLGFLLQGMDKTQLFPAIREAGVLPRKTFSMGEAHEKRYYMEAREIL